jgi:hypothetical protein
MRDPHACSEHASHDGAGGHLAAARTLSDAATSLVAYETHEAAIVACTAEVCGILPSQPADAPETNFPIFSAAAREEAQAVRGVEVWEPGRRGARGRRRTRGVGRGGRPRAPHAPPARPDQLHTDAAIESTSAAAGP